MASAEGVMKRASELRKQGVSNAEAMRQAWAEKHAADAKVRADSQNKR